MVASTLTVSGTATRAITVAAYNAERNHEIGYLSSQGPRVDGHAKPEIAAPGIGIDAPKGNARKTCCLECECCVDRYSAFDGTSQAAPHIAGVIALMLAQNKRLTNVEIEQTLRATARKMADLPPGWPPMADFVQAWSTRWRQSSQPTIAPEGPSQIRRLRRRRSSHWSRGPRGNGIGARGFVPGVTALGRSRHGNCLPLW
jgi:hypothetical protein